MGASRQQQEKSLNCRARYPCQPEQILSFLDHGAGVCHQRGPYTGEWNKLLHLPRDEYGKEETRDVPRLFEQLGESAVVSSIQFQICASDRKSSPWDTKSCKRRKLRTTRSKSSCRLGWGRFSFRRSSSCKARDVSQTVDSLS